MPRNEHAALRVAKHECLANSIPVTKTLSTPIGLNCVLHIQGLHLSFPRVGVTSSRASPSVSWRKESHILYGAAS